MPCSSISPLILPSTINYTNLSSMLQLPPPSMLGVDPIIHNTQTNQVSYPCIPCNIDEIIPAVSMQNIDGHWKQSNKKRNTKNPLCSHYQGDFMFSHNWITQWSCYPWLKLGFEVFYFNIVKVFHSNPSIDLKSF